MMRKTVESKDIVLFTLLLSIGCADARNCCLNLVLH